MSNHRIVIPLDGMNREQSLKLAEKLAPYVWGFKVNDLLIDCGLSIVKELRAIGKVFADPKLHDIPNTVANGIKKLTAAGADLITVHASGGEKMLQAAAENAGSAKILAVTVLTSMTDTDAEYVYAKNAGAAVAHLAMLVAKAGVSGVVCSPQELSLLMENQTTAGLYKVIPGVRPTWAGADDQKRVMTPGEAIKMGADLLVVGRPITGHADPIEAAKLVNAEVEQALNK